MADFWILCVEVRARTNRHEKDLSTTIEGEVLLAAKEDYKSFAITSPPPAPITPHPNDHTDPSSDDSTTTGRNYESDSPPELDRWVIDN
jgi:hypothetical protein